jgi:dGTPase
MVSGLANYAVTEKKSRGRQFLEKPHPYRTDFERDRDRIIHCSAFRRLEGKTQVFTPGLDDYYRTRLTHSIEVAQIGRTIAKALRLNESLTEAICLAHDLGHPPFGHAGEKILNELMTEFGGFEHNQQTMRIIDLLEHPYPDFMGLNLMYETRLGLAKHKSRYDRPTDDSFAEKNCSLEGQVADIADRIAYNCHDLEDGMRASLISVEQLTTVEIFTEAQQSIRVLAKPAFDLPEGMAKPKTGLRPGDRTIRRTRTAKTIINMLVSDCIEASKKKISEANIKIVDDVYGRTENLIVLSADSEAKLNELEEFLLENFYRHRTLMETAEKVKTWLGKLFESLCRDKNLMPAYFRSFIPQQGLERTVCDYIAGMTDRFCLKMLKKD